MTMEANAQTWLEWFYMFLMETNYFSFNQQQKQT